MPDDEIRALAESRLGRVLKGKYRLDRVLGMGGMAAVYAATHRNKKRFAIKMLHPELAARESVRARFLREGYVANSVGHPGAVTVLDDDVAEDGCAFVVMDLLQGSALDELAARQPGHKLPLGLVLSIGDALLDVLAAAHARGIVHRDVKPANLFLTDDGRLQVLDFGIARLRDETGGAQATQTGALLGTPAFMAPEQALAEPSRIDGQTDLWAVGATLFTLLSGELVHDASNAAQVAIRAATTPARSLATVAPEVPRAVVDWIDRALAFEKAKRWENATAMRQALARACLEATGAPIPPLPVTERVSATGTTAASEPASPPRSARLGDVASPAMNGRLRPIAPWAFGAAMAICALGAATWWRVHGEHAAATPAPSAIAPSTPEMGQPPATAEAAAAYAAALQADHDGNSSASDRYLRAAVKSDPALGSAYLRLAISMAGSGGWYSLVAAEAHDAFKMAVEHRGTLATWEREVLDAWKPRFADPPDHAERLRRIQPVADRYPSNAYVQLLLAQAMDATRQPVLGAVERAIAADATYVPAYAYGAARTLFFRDPETSRALLRRCLSAAPTAVDCITSWAFFDDEDGRCDEVVADGRRAVAADPSSPEGNRILGYALFSRGTAIDTVAQVLTRGLDGISDEDERKDQAYRVHMDVAELQGDFAAAQVALAQQVATRSARGDALGIGLLLHQAVLSLETGDEATAKTLVTKARSLSSTAVGVMPARVLALLARLGGRVGLLSPAETAEETERQMKARGAPGDADLFHLEFWYLPRRALDLRDADAAVRVLDERGVTVPPTLGGLDAAHLGSAYLLAGHYVEARDLLQRSIGASCGILAFHRDYVLSDFDPQFRLDLGLAREKTGDLAGAKAAYARVLAAWGHAKPRSLTAEAAKAGLARVEKSLGP
jgi:serine/threonine-protein kinase